MREGEGKGGREGGREGARGEGREELCEESGNEKAREREREGKRVVPVKSLVHGFDKTLVKRQIYPHRALAKHSHVCQVASCPIQLLWRHASSSHGAQEQNGNESYSTLTPLQHPVNAPWSF